MLSVSVALVIQHAKRMRRIILPPVASLSVPHFPTFFINGTIFGKNVTEHKMCILIFSTNLSEIFVILRRINRDIVVNVHTSRSSCKVLGITLRF
jgi:hypothetical protein